MQYRMKRRPLLIALLTILVGSTLLFPQQTDAQSGTQKTAIILDGYPLGFGAEPILNQGVTRVPFRGIAEALNIQVQWNGKQQTITVIQKTSTGSKQVVLTRIRIVQKEVETARLLFFVIIGAGGDYKLILIDSGVGDAPLIHGVWFSAGY